MQISVSLSQKKIRKTPSKLLWMSQFETKLLASETTKKGRHQEYLRSNFWKFK